MSDKNLKLWESVNTTDPAYTKKFKQGFSGTAINSTYLVMLATKMFGKIGFGWGYEIIEERIDVGADVYNSDGETIGQVKTHTLRIDLWVKEGQEIGRVTHFGHTPYIYYSKNGGYWVTDQEAPKKSLTDAIKKCLSMFGFSADIYLGLYDDGYYVDEVKEKFAVENSDNKAEEELKQKHEYNDLLDKNIKLIDEALIFNLLEGIYKSIIRKAKRKEDKEAQVRIINATEKAKKRLTKKDDNNE